MGKKFAIGDCIHVNAKSGGGQLYTIVGMNEQYLFLSYEIMYKNYDTSAKVTVLPRNSTKITNSKEKHACNCSDCEL